MIEEFDADKQSRSHREQAMTDALKLALQVREEKSTPWTGASNVKFPLLTIAALQFQSRAYAALIQGPRVVKCLVNGDDPDGQYAAQADRIAEQMSWQILEQDENWEEETDKALMALPITGCVFKKTYFDAVKGYNVSVHILPHDFVLPYYAKSVETAERKTQVLWLTAREIKARQVKGIYVDIELPDASPSSDYHPSVSDRDETPAQDAPRQVLEQHRYWDLDGDGYAEPYIVTVDKASAKVLRMAARFKDIQRSNDAKIKRLAQSAMGMMQHIKPEEQAEALPALHDVEAEIEELKKTAKVTHIEPIEYFTKYPFIPSPDGSIYDLGFGEILGPVNHSVDTLINQLIDAGTLSNANSGFIGRGGRIRGGDLRFKPFEWKRMDVSAGALKDNIFPLPVREPSQTLFSLLELLINYGERVSSVSDLMVGQTPGQNTPMGTSMAALEQGMKVYSGIVKRLYRALKAELRKWFWLNRLNHLSADYQIDPKRIVPQADPSMVSTAERMQQAQFLAQRAAASPGYNVQQVELRLLEAMRIPDTEQVYPIANPIPAQPNPELELKKVEAQRKTLESQAQTHKIYSELEIKAEETKAKIANLTAQAVLYQAEAESKAGAEEVARIETQIKALETAHTMIQDIINANRQNRDSGLAGASGHGGVLPDHPGPSGGTGQRESVPAG